MQQKQFSAAAESVGEEGSARERRGERGREKNGWSGRRGDWERGGEQGRKERRRKEGRSRRREKKRKEIRRRWRRIKEKEGSKVFKEKTHRKKETGNRESQGVGEGGQAVTWKKKRERKWKRMRVEEKKKGRKRGTEAEK